MAETAPYPPGTFCWPELATTDQQSAVRAAAAKAIVRFIDLTKQQDEALLGSLFEKQGLKVVPPSEMLRNQYFAAVRA